MDLFVKNKGTDEDNRKIRLSIIKNVIFVGISFFFLFASYNSITYLQSSMNRDTGTNSLSVTYGTLVLSCMFISNVMIDKLKEKKTMIFSMWGYLLYIAAQFYPVSYTLLPSAAIVGICGAPLWAAKCTYLTNIARIYAKVSGEKAEVIVTRFFGIFFFLYQNAIIWGSVISSTVLATDPTIVSGNDSERLNHCGSKFCPDYSLNSSVDLAKEISEVQRYTMATIYLIIAALASVILMFFLDPLSSYKIDSCETKTTKQKSWKELMISTADQCKKPYQLLIIPLTIWSRIEQAFLIAEFTSAYVGCGLGVYMIGYVLICYGVCDALSSVISSYLVKKCGRIFVMFMATVINASTILAFLFWNPNPERPIIFFILSGLWGFSDGAWHTQIAALYGVLFPESSEAAFSNYMLWGSLGYIIAYVCSGLLCTMAKIYMLIGFLSFGMIGYIIIEILIYRQNLKINEKN